jgi:hypothetical protein
MNLQAISKPLLRSSETSDEDRVLCASRFSANVVMPDRRDARSTAKTRRKRMDFSSRAAWKVFFMSKNSKDPPRWKQAESHAGAWKRPSLAGLGGSGEFLDGVSSCRFPVGEGNTEDPFVNKQALFQEKGRARANGLARTHQPAQMQFSSYKDPWGGGR